MTARFDRPGIRLNIVEAGDGLDFIWQHGLCADAAQPAEVFPERAAFKRVTLECRGHGQSELGDPEQVSIASFAEDVSELIKQRQAAPVVLGGISLGAAIALRIAATQPKLMRALILGRPAWVHENAPSNMRAYAEIGQLLSRFPADQARAIFDASATAAWLAKEGPDNLASLRSFFTREPQSWTATLLTKIGGDGPGLSVAEIESISVPTLVIAQEQDPLHPVASAEQLAAFIQGARLERITPKAANRTRYVADFRAALLRFLADLRIDPSGFTG